MARHKQLFRILICAVLLLITVLPLSAQELSSDSLIVSSMEQEGVSFSHNNSIVLLSSGQQKFDDMFAAIRNAKESIHLEYFNFRNDSIAGLLFDILADKVKEGVEVRALFDAFGNASNNQPLTRKHIKAIKQRGIQIKKFDPLRFPWINHAFTRDHRKIVVIDGQVAYTGGMNVADYYIKGTDVVGEWHDMHCRIEGDEVNTLQKIFLKIWNKATHQNVHGPQYYYGCPVKPFMESLPKDTSTTAGSKTIAIINREPIVSNKIIRKFYVNAINLAQDSIKLINPYFTLTRSLKRAFRKAVERGVKVEIMLSVKSDIPLTPDCGFYNAHKLMKRGCHIWMFEPGFHHTKIMMVDGKFCTLGSANLNARSLKFDYEDNVIIVDPNTTAEMDRLFERDKKRSFLLTEERWNAWRTPWKKFVGWFAHLLAPVL